VTSVVRGDTRPSSSLLNVDNVDPSDACPQPGKKGARSCAQPLGLVDAAVIACAERNAYRTLTLDQRDFGVVARDLPLRLLPAT
jgi:hypothetical protein